MANVYYSKVDHCSDTREIKAITRKLLEKIIKDENIELADEVPLKVHFGEKGNQTFIKPDNFDGIIDLLDERNIKTSFMETSVLYGGERFKKELHINTAKEHGFTRVPVVIADGDLGDDFVEVYINKDRFDKCKIGKEFSKYEQLIVVSHFKGHMLAGFGGAIKQLSMGVASKGGKLAMHMGVKPHIINRKCKKCHLCEKRCNESAITIGRRSFIDHEKCVGCGACVSICPYKATSIISVKSILRVFGIGNPFKEKLAEYAYAAHNGKRNIYINFAMNITPGCDCEPKKMKPLIGDIGVFISMDPVAVDKACYDAASAKGKRFKGTEIFKYAEKIGLGTSNYALVEV